MYKFTVILIIIFSLCVYIDIYHLIFNFNRINLFMLCLDGMWLTMNTVDGLRQFERRKL